MEPMPHPDYGYVPFNKDDTPKNDSNDDDTLTKQELKLLPVSYVVVNRESYLLKLFVRPEGGKEYKEKFKCAIATGIKTNPTRPGPHMVMAKARHPQWLVPNSQWAIDMGLKPGTVIKGGVPDNPIREAFLRLTTDGIGIHGTTNLQSLKTRASHGCIRVSPKNAIRLYDQVEVGSPVYIK